MFYGLMVCSLVVLAAGVKHCPSNWVPYDESCYYFQQSKTTFTKDLANERCKSHDFRSSLVSVETKAELNFLKAHLTNIYSGISGRTANGWLTSGKKDGAVWTWTTTGAAIDMSIFTWGPGEPDGQSCLSLWPKYGFDMADVFCSSYERQYICEI